MAQAARRYNNYDYDYDYIDDNRQLNFERLPNKNKEHDTHKKHHVHTATQNETRIHSGFIQIAIFGFVIALTIFACFIIGTSLSTQTSLKMASAQTIQKDINDAIYEGEQLELEHARLSSLNRIQTESTKLGMQPAGAPVYITLPNVAQKAISGTFDDGSLSLEKTLNNIVNAQYK
ncbi:MAG: hypothetical protein MJ189_01610 [Coriobacteriales bacterium]|nr:hypothetical protein [Coriobacteriales bacterium]